MTGFESLQQALLACWHIYASFKQHSDIESTIFRRQIPPALLPLCIALLDAERWAAVWEGREKFKREESSSAQFEECGDANHDGAVLYSVCRLFRTSYDSDDEEDAEDDDYGVEDVRGLLDTLYNNPGQLLTQLSSMPRGDMQRIMDKHRIIDSMALQFAPEASALLRPNETGATALSPTEYFHFCRALYRVDLYYNIFPGKWRRLGDSRVELFHSKHAVWELEQVACAYDFLEDKLCQCQYLETLNTLMEVNMSTQGLMMLLSMTLRLPTINRPITTCQRKTRTLSRNYG